MAKAFAQVHTTYRLHLNDKEVRYLQELLQNGPVEEDAKRSEIRKGIWEALTEPDVGHHGLSP